MSGQVDEQRMIDTACAFFLAAERCTPEIGFADYPMHEITAPVFCNFALATEISLKLLLQIHHVEAPRGFDAHDLSKLFNCIPDNSRSFLDGFETELADCRRYFVDWRYPYEKEELIGSCSGLRRIFILCHREIRRLKPSLSSMFEQNWGSFEPKWLWDGHRLDVTQQRLANDRP